MSIGIWKVMELGDSLVRLEQRVKVFEIVYVGWEKGILCGSNIKVKGQELVNRLISLKN